MRIRYRLLLILWLQLLTGCSNFFHDSENNANASYYFAGSLVYDVLFEDNYFSNNYNPLYRIKDGVETKLFPDDTLPRSSASIRYDGKYIVYMKGIAPANSVAAQIGYSFGLIANEICISSDGITESCLFKDTSLAFVKVDYAPSSNLIALSVVQTGPPGNNMLMIFDESGVLQNSFAEQNSDFNFFIWATDDMLFLHNRSQNSISLRSISGDAFTDLLTTQNFHNFYYGRSFLKWQDTVLIGHHDSTGLNYRFLDINSLVFKPYSPLVADTGRVIYFDETYTTHLTGAGAIRLNKVTQASDTAEIQVERDYFLAQTNPREIYILVEEGNDSQNIYRYLFSTGVLEKVTGNGENYFIGTVAMN